MNKGFAGFPPMQEGYSAGLVCKTKYQGGSFDYLQHEYNARHLLTIRGIFRTIPIIPISAYQEFFLRIVLRSILYCPGDVIHGK